MHDLRPTADRKHALDSEGAGEAGMLINLTRDRFGLKSVNRKGILTGGSGCRCHASPDN